MKTWLKISIVPLCLFSITGFAEEHEKEEIGISCDYDVSAASKLKTHLKPLQIN